MSKEIQTMECLGEDCFLCRNIRPNWLEIVRLKREVLQFEKGVTIFNEGDRVKGIYFILTGKVKVDMSWGNKRYIVRLAGDGEILGHRGFGIDEVYPINATPLETTTVCFIPTELFSTLLKTNTKFLYELTFFYAEELKRTERRMKNLAHMPVKGRLAEALLMIRDAFGTEKGGALTYRMSRKDLASMASTTYESVIRMLNELVADGLVALENKDITLLDQEGLARCCQQKKAG